MNEQIVNASKQPGWDSELFYSFHSLRHGRAVDLRAENKSVAELRGRGRWNSNASRGYEAIKLDRDRRVVGAKANERPQEPEVLARAARGSQGSNNTEQQTKTKRRTEEG